MLSSYFYSSLVTSCTNKVYRWKKFNDGNVFQKWMILEPIHIGYYGSPFVITNQGLVLKLSNIKEHGVSKNEEWPWWAFIYWFFDHLWMILPSQIVLIPWSMLSTSRFIEELEEEWWQSAPSTRIADQVTGWLKQEWVIKNQGTNNSVLQDNLI